MSSKPLCQCFEEELNAVIDKYRDQGLTYGESFGVLESVKLNLWYEQIKNKEEELENDDDSLLDD